MQAINSDSINTKWTIHITEHYNFSEEFTGSGYVGCKEFDLECDAITFKHDIENTLNKDIVPDYYLTCSDVICTTINTY